MKQTYHFLSGDRGTYWCAECVYTFLHSHGNELEYEDASDFVPETLRRTRKWTAAQALRCLATELAPIGLLGPENVRSSAPKPRGDRMADAVRIPGARSIRCTACGEIWGGEHSFKRHRPYKGADAGKCRSGEQLNLTLKNGVWRNAAASSQFLKGRNNQ